MSRKEKSIELLNKAVADELLAVHQYMYFHFRCDDMGYDLLSGLFKRTAIQEMMHVETAFRTYLVLERRSGNENLRGCSENPRTERNAGIGHGHGRR